MVKVEVGNKEYEVKIAHTDEEREEGLQNVEKLPKKEGMLFCFDEPEEVSFWMKDTLINLDIVFIDEDEYVIKVVTGYAGTEDAHTCPNTKYVLEVNQGSGIKPGDEVFIEECEEEKEGYESDDEDEGAMHVLDENGKSQMALEGGERIFSRKHTKALVKFGKRAFASKSDKDYKALGKRIFSYIEYQDNKDEDYVEIKKEKP